MPAKRASTPPERSRRRRALGRGEAASVCDVMGARLLAPFRLQLFLRSKAERGGTGGVLEILGGRASAGGSQSLDLGASDLEVSRILRLDLIRLFFDGGGIILHQLDVL